MKTFLWSLGGAILGTILAVVIIVFAGIAFINGSQPKTEQEQGKSLVLSVDLRNGYDDQAATSGPEVLFGGGTGFIDIITKLDAAASDEQVKAVVLRASEYGVGSARAEELRDAIIKLKESGKFVIAHSQGTYGGGPSAYRAVSAADEIWVQPSSDLIASGITFETLFLKGLFDNLSVTPEFEALYEYKNAVNTYEEEDYTEPHRLAMTELAESLWEISLEDIATDRGMTVAAARTALENSPISAERMVEVGLANRTGWPEEAAGFAVLRAAASDAEFTNLFDADNYGDDIAMVDISGYQAPSSPFGSPVIAVVGGQGPIISGYSGGSLFQEGSGFASDSIAASILDAGRDEDVQAIVFRVDSPGGSPTASDQIWRAIELVQEQRDIPVVVSMASVAASGGYYVSTGSDWIVANRTTITGSIGIFGGKFAIEEGLARIGVNAESIKVGGTFTGAFTTTEGLTDEQRVMMRSWLKRGYDRFISLVAEGRKMGVDEVDAVARGRVWSGQDAIEQGLVDELGGLTTAIAKAKELAEIDAETEVRLITYPMQQGGFPFLGVSSAASASASELEAIGQLADIINSPEVQALVSEAEAARSSRIQARLPSFIER